MYTEELEKEGSLRSYQSFYSSVSNKLGDVRKVLRKVREGKKLDKRDYDSLSSFSNTAVGSYNSFI
ncbi:hypothetical protein [Myroides profundi]|uniref:Uncharacterized protein n=1 Tax=Myroides profundi TaxID=480520 RepID=A0AAJ5BEW1_MYRPR|nr:hypothetical protein [Myroides profundi]AJH15808.1 hypothetical protein MPR_2642 [Myroides profundi]SER31479.1 hypothetical protein SAMN04488089_11317 [Myroides profundi]